MAYAQREGALGSSRTSLRDFNGRLFRYRANANGASSEGDAEQLEGEGDGMAVVTSAKNPNFPDQKEVGLRQRNRWEVWVGGDFNTLDLDNSLDFAGFQQDTWAGSLGLEYAATRSWTVGFGLTGLESDGDASEGIGGFDMKGLTLAAYTGYSRGPWYVDLLYGASFFDHDMVRRTGFGSTAQAETDSLVHAVDFHTGWNFTRGNFVTGPLLGVRYAHVSVDGYTETGGGDFDTSVESQSQDSLVGELGWQASYRIPTNWGAIVPQVRVSWEREFLDGDDSVGVALVNSPYYAVTGSTVRRLGGSFGAGVTPPSSEQDFLAVGAGVMVECGPRVRVLADYQGYFLGDGISDHTVSLRLSLAL
jgi:outer membrane lipase/esterase